MTLKDWLAFALVFGGWFLVARYLLPKLGVGT